MFERTKTGRKRDAHGHGTKTSSSLNVSKTFTAAIVGVVEGKKRTT
jgi:hypothetical protein